MRWIFLLCLIVLGSVQAAPRTFEEAKTASKQYVYYDQNTSAMGDLYCGCKWNWVGKSGGRMNLGDCGYTPRTNPERAARMEWEHIVPASTFGHQRQCWQNGGRENCNRTDPTFNLMEADMHNLYPSVGEVNGDRSNLNYGMALNLPNQYGMCRTKVDFKGRAAEPRAEAKGIAARVTFYMYDRYGLRMSAQQEQMFMAWNNAFPVTAWEKERNARITKIMGVTNPFVTGQKVWTRNYRPAGGNDVSAQEIYQRPNAAPMPAIPAGPAVSPPAGGVPIVGNRNSQIYHIYGHCPSYNDVSPNNRIVFVSEQQAINSGYRKAKNCR